MLGALTRWLADRAWTVSVRSVLAAGLVFGLVAAGSLATWRYRAALDEARQLRVQLGQAVAERDRAARMLAAADGERRKAVAAAQAAGQRASAIRAEIAALHRALGAGGCDAALELIRRQPRAR